MKNAMKWLAFAATGALFFSCQQQGGGISQKTSLATDDEKISYAIGQDMGNTLKQLDAKLDLSMVFRGIQDIMEKDSSQSLLTPEERQKSMELLMTRIRESRAKKDSLAGMENEAKAKAFLEKNKSEKGVITTASGLEYMVLQEGSGVSPKGNDQVTAHYVGTLLDGTEFDNSIKRGQPITFAINNVIPGWQELLPLMKVGEKVKCWVPPNLAYGPRSAGRIPSNSMLIFEVELLDVKAAVDTGKPAAVKTEAKPVAAAKPAASAAPAAAATPATK
ncbi:MAG TPA: FKBP-type peptidyl-prolyl cis-trans isomerase [Fibrobacteraceae bacterium]|nr:FKBP-type peptidyl-prolyl cis-trans isomerase [Fibrobacteraceae bacterium]